MEKGREDGFSFLSTIVSYMLIKPQAIFYVLKPLVGLPCSIEHGTKISVSPIVQMFSLQKTPNIWFVCNRYLNAEYEILNEHCSEDL